MKISDIVETVKKSFPEISGILLCNGLYKEIPLGTNLIYYTASALGLKEEDPTLLSFLMHALKEIDKGCGSLQGSPPFTYEKNVRFFLFTRKKEKEKFFKNMIKKKYKMKSENWIEL